MAQIILTFIALVVSIPVSLVIVGYMEKRKFEKAND